MDRPAFAIMSNNRYMPPEEWLQTLDPVQREKADRMIALLAQFHADDPVSWVSSEMREGIPQVARFMFLHGVRQYVLEDKSFVQGEGNTGNQYYPFAFSDENTPEHNSTSTERIDSGLAAFYRLVEAGVDRQELVRVARAAIAMTVFAFIDYLDNLQEFEWEHLEDAPNWSLRETGTGRGMGGLHESFGSLYDTDK